MSFTYDGESWHTLLCLDPYDGDADRLQAPFVGIDDFAWKKVTGMHADLWYNETIAEAILNWIMHDSYQILIDGEKPMREIHGLEDVF